jgi:hypothetical protein
MATFEQLTAEQRAILELILRRGQSYEQLSEKLDLPESRVRELAREALVELAPITAQRVDEEWRGQLADYVLGQQAGPESTATRGHLRRSEAARSWARSLLDSLDDLYGDPHPAIPDGERAKGGRGKREAAAASSPAPSPEAKPARPARQPLSREGGGAFRKRRLAVAGGVLALLLLGLLLWPIGLLTGDDEGGSEQAASKPKSSNASAGANAKTRGQALVFERAGKQQVLVTAVGLAPSSDKQAYEAWLFNSNKDAKSLGLTVTDQQGRLQGGAALPADYAKYKFIDLSLEPIDKNRSHSGQSKLRGVLEMLDKPVFQGKGKNRVKVVATISLVPLPS